MEEKRLGLGLGWGYPAVCRRCERFISVSPASIRGGGIPLPLPFPSLSSRYWDDAGEGPRGSSLLLMTWALVEKQQEMDYP